MKSLLFLFTMIIRVFSFFFILSVLGGRTTGKVQPSDEEDLPKTILSFGLEMMKKMRSNEVVASEENTMISPVNVYTTLFLAYIGSAGTTKNELASVLGFHHPEAPHHLEMASEVLSGVIRKLEVKHENVLAEESFANGIFVQQDFPLKDEYKRMVAKHFTARVANLDFSQHANEATDTINKWISDKTRGRILNFYKVPLDSATKIVLTSALYFSGIWDKQFSETSTKIEKFNTGVKEINVQMMSENFTIPYMKNEKLKFEAIRLPYAARDFEMVIFLPDASHNIDTMMQDMQTEDFFQVFERNEKEAINVKLPKIKFMWSRSLKEVLHKQGVKSLFEAADLSRLSAVSKLHVSEVDHITEMEIDEKGTRASAVTGMQMVPVSLPYFPNDIKMFVVNRAFLMMLYHRPTKTVSFSAVVHNPTN